MRKKETNKQLYANEILALFAFSYFVLEQTTPYSRTYILIYDKMI